MDLASIGLTGAGLAIRPSARVEEAFRQAADNTAAKVDRGFHDQLRIEEQITLGEVDARLAVQGFILAQVLGGAGCPRADSSSSGRFARSL